MQTKMKKYLIDILGDKLLKEPLPEYPLEPGIKLPSPEDLKYKILCKFRNKKPKKSNKEKISANNSSKEESDTFSLPTSDQYFITEFTDVPLSELVNFNTLFSHEESSKKVCQSSELKSEMLEQLCDHMEKEKLNSGSYLKLMLNEFNISIKCF